MVKHQPAMRETRVRSLGQEDGLEKEMATHSSILAWKISWTEEPGGLQSMGSQRVGHDWVINTPKVIHTCKCAYTCTSVFYPKLKANHRSGSEMIWSSPCRMSWKSLHNKDWPHSFEGLHSIPHSAASSFSSEKQCGSKHPTVNSLVGVSPGCIPRSGLDGSNTLCILKIDRWCVLSFSNHNST